MTMTEFMTDTRFICSHAADRSLRMERFAFSGAILYDFTAWFGALAIGETRKIIVRLDGVEHVATIGYRDFDRAKWYDRPEMYQMRYNKTGTLAKSLQAKFATTRKIIEQILRAEGLGFGKRHIKIPPAQREQILFYRMDNPSVWDAEVQSATESYDVTRAIGGVGGTVFDAENWIDTAAKIEFRPALIKVRRFDRTIGQNPKCVYDHCCQICGSQVAQPYGTHVDEIHHIDRALPRSTTTRATLSSFAKTTTASFTPLTPNSSADNRHSSITTA